MNNQERYEKDLKIIPKGESKTYVIDGLDTVIYRTDMGHLCGYVCVPEDTEIDWVNEIHCHGGITFQDWRDFFITNGYYIGFDCAHSGDWSPYSPEIFKETYKDVDFVQNELKNIIEQVKGKLK